MAFEQGKQFGRFDAKKTTSAVNEPEEVGGDAGDGKDADSPENRQAYASKMSAAAHSASSGAFSSGSAEDHKKSAMKHAMAFVANKMAGNKNEADAHLEHVDKHTDAWGQCHETGTADDGE